MVQPFGRCRVCGGTDLQFLFSLGEQYLNNFVDPGHEQCGERWPIELELCRSCTLVQLRHTAPQELLYTGRYWYRSGVTETMRKALRDVVECSMRMVEAKSGDVFLDIGSNDGTLLRRVPEFMCRVGVEPAKNLAHEGALGIDHFINDFWDADEYLNVVGRQAKVITAIGMFYDLDDPNKFIADVSRALHPEGVFVAQLMCLRNMVDMMDVGNLAHEHLEFYSLRSLDRLLGNHDLEIVDILLTNVNGKSYRIYCRHKKSGIEEPVGASTRLHSVRVLEEGLDNPYTHRAFFHDLEERKQKVRQFIEGEYCRGRSTWVYGASTKGNVILQYYGLDHRLIMGAADRSLEKWGKVTIGTGIPIVSEEEARLAAPAYFLVLPYGFLDEFIEREQEWLEGGGVFIVPLPEPRLIGRVNGVTTETLL